MKLDLPKDREFDAGLWYSTPASSYFPTHCHDELELKIVLCGRAVVSASSASIALGPGSMLWMAPGQEHLLKDVSEDFAMWVASFRTSAVHVAQRLSGTRVLDGRATWGVCSLFTPEIGRLSRLCGAQLSYQHPREANRNAHRILVGALSAWQSHADESSVAGDCSGERWPLHPAVRRARLMLREDDGDQPLEGLSRSCGLSASRLSRLFKWQMGLSVVQFRNHHRVQSFIARFGDGNALTMLEAALDGFGSYSQFHRAFHQVTGYAPAEHLRRVRAGLVIPRSQADHAKATAHPCRLG